MYKIDLMKDKGYPWYRAECCACKGYAWYQDECYQGERLLELFGSIQKEELIPLLQQLCGSFAGYLEDENAVYLFADIIRSIPLFYDVKHRQISDDVVLLAQKTGVDAVDVLAVMETIQTSVYACGERTWCENIKQTMAGEVVILPKQPGASVEQKVYYMHKQTDRNDKQDVSAYYDEADEVAVDVFGRLIESLQGRTAIIPLSGGYDSRFIVGMLKRLHYENVVCFTYGKSKNNVEAEVSKKVADQLGYPHFFVEYTPELCEEILGKDRDEYRKHGTCYSNLTHYQDFFAVKELCKNPAFPKDGVFLPGHSGDLFGGTWTLNDHQTAELVYDLELVRDVIYQRFFDMSKYQGVMEEEIKQDILDYLKRYNCTATDLVEANSAIQQWFVPHRQGFFIVNSIRVYDYFGYSWQVPLWDRKLADFWNDIPIRYKQSNSLYEQYLFERVFCPLNIDFKKGGEKQRYQICGPERPWYRYAITGLLNRAYLNHGLRLRFWEKNPLALNEFAYVIYQAIQHKRWVGFSRCDTNELACIYEIERFLEETGSSFET